MNARRNRTRWLDGSGEASRLGRYAQCANSVFNASRNGGRSWYSVSTEEREEVPINLDGIKLTYVRKTFTCTCTKTSRVSERTR